MNRFGLFFLSMVLWSSLPAAEGEAWIVIVNPPDDATTIRLDAQTGKDFAVGKVSKWADGKVVDLFLPSKSSGMLNPLARALGHKNAASLQRHWLRLTFSGRSDPPRFLKSEAAIIEHVTAHRGAVGVIRASDPGAVDFGVDIAVIPLPETL